MMIVAGAALVGGASLISDDFEPGGDYDYLGASGVGHDYDGGGAAISRLLYMGRRGLKSLQLLAPGVGEAEVGKEHGGGSGAGGGVPTALLGNLFVVAAQFAAASQFVVEEKYLVQYRVRCCHKGRLTLMLAADEDESFVLGWRSMFRVSGGGLPHPLQLAIHSIDTIRDCMNTDGPPILVSVLQVPTLLAVGLEGFYGLVICAIACPLLSNVTFCGQPVDSWGGAVQVRGGGGG